MPSNSPSSAKALTSADLALIDAAIAMYKAAQMNQDVPTGAPAITLQPDFLTDIVQAVMLAATVTIIVAHAVKGRFTMSAQLAGLPAGVPTTASLNELIAKRNELAKALGDPSVLS